MDWQRACVVACALVALGPDGCGANYRVEVTLRNDWTENIHLYVLDSAGGGVSEGKASRNRVSPNGESRTVVLEYDDPGSYDIILRAGRDGMADSDYTCTLDLLAPEDSGEEQKFEVAIEAIWGPGWLPCRIEIEPA